MVSEGSKVGSVVDGKGVGLGDGIGVGDGEGDVDGVVSGASTAAVRITDGKVDSEVGTEGNGSTPQPVKRRSKTEKVIRLRKQNLFFAISPSYKYETIIAHYVNRYFHTLKLIYFQLAQ